MPRYTIMRPQESLEINWKMKTRIIILFAWISLLISSCSQEIQSQQSVSDEYEYKQKDHEKKNCLSIEKNTDGHLLCKPNINFLFSNFNEFDGNLISFDGFARFSSRGSLLIYPSQDMACGGIDNSSIEAFLDGQLPADVVNEIGRGGIAKISVFGRARANKVVQVLPTIGGLVDAQVEINSQPDEIFLISPKNLVRGSPKDSDFGKIRKFTCT